MGLEGAGDLQEASPVLQSGIWQELKVLRAPQDLQVWSSPGGVVSITSGIREPSEVLPKLRQPQKKPWKGKSSCSRLLQLLADLALGSSEEFLAGCSAGYPGVTRNIPRGFPLLPPLCSVLGVGVIFIGTSPSYSWFPSFPHALPAIPWGKNLLCMSYLCLIITQHLIN